MLAIMQSPYIFDQVDIDNAKACPTSFRSAASYVVNERVVEHRVHLAKHTSRHQADTKPLFDAWMLGFLKFLGRTSWLNDRLSVLCCICVRRREKYTGGAVALSHSRPYQIRPNPLLHDNHDHNRFTSPTRVKGSLIIVIHNNPGSHWK